MNIDLEFRLIATVALSLSLSLLLSHKTKPNCLL